MRRTRISILCAAVLAALPIGAEAEGLGCAARGDVAAFAGIAPGGDHGAGSAQEFLRFAQ